MFYGSSISHEKLYASPISANEITDILFNEYGVHFDANRIADALCGSSDSLPWRNQVGSKEIKDKLVSEVSFIVACELLDDEVDSLSPTGLDYAENCSEYIDVLLQTKNPKDEIGCLFHRAGRAIAQNGYFDSCVSGYLLEASFLNAFLDAQFKKCHDIRDFDEYLTLCGDKAGSMLALIFMMYFPNLTKNDVDVIRAAGVGLQLIDDVEDSIPDRNSGASNGVVILQHSNFNLESCVIETYVLDEAVKICGAAKDMVVSTTEVSQCLAGLYKYVFSIARPIQDISPVTSVRCTDKIAIDA